MPQYSMFTGQEYSIAIYNSLGESISINIAHEIAEVNFPKSLLLQRAVRPRLCKHFSLKDHKFSETKKFCKFQS